MKNVKRIGIVVGGLVAMALVMVLAAPKAAHAVEQLLVTVTNTSANPVPVAGNVNVTNQPAVNIGSMPSVEVSSMPSLQLSGTPSVTVGNGSANPIPTLGAEAVNSFVAAATCQWGPGTETSMCQATVYSVPANKIAVIESVSAECSSGSVVNSEDSFSFTGPGGLFRQTLFAPTVTSGGEAATMAFWRKTTRRTLWGDIVSILSPTPTGT